MGITLIKLIDNLGINLLLQSWFLCNSHQIVIFASIYSSSKINIRVYCPLLAIIFKPILHLFANICEESWRIRQFYKMWNKPLPDPINSFIAKFTLGLYQDNPCNPGKYLYILYIK